MNLYPAIDIFEGKCVRLTRGDYAQKKVYFDHPEEAAKLWAQQGAQWIHLVDLEGARDGKLVNLASICRIRETVSCHLEVGGGLRTLEDIETVLSAGIDRVILGTKALDPDFLAKAVKAYGSKIAVGLDVRDGHVQTQGWLKEGGQSLEDALTFLAPYGIQTLIYTDIKKDGMLQGPNFESLADVLSKTKSRVILSGGVSTLEDLKQCLKVPNSNFDGAIVGKAIYEKKFTVAQALEVLTGASKGGSS